MIQATPRILTRGEALAIPSEHCPMLVLSDNLRSWVSRRIKAHTEGNYNHAMWLWYQGVVATQGWRFHAAKLDDYLNGQYRVKFWWNPHWDWKKWMMKKDIEDDIETAGRYDWCGVVGQLAASICKIPGLTKINFPGRHYCSEEAGDILRRVEHAFLYIHPSPADLDRWCKDAVQMQVYGVFDPTL